MSVVTHSSAPAAPPTSTAAREWTPHIWEGCNLHAWLRLLWQNRCAVSPAKAYVAAIVTMVSTGHSLTRLGQNIWYGRRVQRTPIHHPPLFILGHWRNGTTLLHELLTLDERHTYPNTYECLVPNHFLLSERVLKPLVRAFMPSRRPFDNMAVGWDRPQEDEFALCLLGLPSIYETIAFPNRLPQDPAVFDLERMSPRLRETWKRTFVRLLKQLTFKDPRRLVLKSPTHSGRIKTMLELFPEAKFVHIVRDPHVVFSSTLHMWKVMYQAHGLQKPTFAGLEEHVFRHFTHLYQRLEAEKGLIPAGQFYELRYEDLVAEPLEQMQRLYETLNLGGFGEVLPRLKQYLEANANYQTNRYPQLSPELNAEIERRWGDVIRRYGYTFTSGQTA
jgi:hypothetical protein